MTDDDFGTGRSHMDDENEDLNKGEKTSPGEVKENVKQTVAKGVAAVAGALNGFTEEAKKNDLAGSTKQAIQKAGETTREVAGTAKKEFRRTKEHLKREPEAMGGSMGGTSSGDLGNSSLDSGSFRRSTATDVPDLRKTELGTQSDIKTATSAEEENE